MSDTDGKKPDDSGFRIGSVVEISFTAPVSGVFNIAGKTVELKKGESFKHVFRENENQGSIYLVKQLED